ncbi:MAG TPA: Ku protein [Pyrinomonadaceae bacterium]|nr:Ku protein [Pyrinomonadaceae bacterium]
MPKTTKKRSRSKSKASNGEEQSGGRPFWSGTLTFGLVSVPVSLFPASRTVRAPLKMLGPDGQPLARKYFSQKTEKDLDADEIVRGYETDKGKFVVITDDELERLEPDKSRDIALKSFVPEDSIPPIYFERGYFLAPEGNSQKAYKLLAETMKKTSQAGVATFVMRGKEYLVAIFSDNGILRAEVMRFSDELRSPKQVDLPKIPKVAAVTVRKFEKLIGSKSKKTFSTAKLKDQETERLLKLVKKKQSKRKNIVEIEDADAPDQGKVIDLMAVLKKSLVGKSK